VLIDVTRLALRRARGLLPTGVDRVGLAHVEHHRDRARAVLVHRRFCAVLRAADSRAAFDWLLSPPPPTAEGLRAWARLARWCLRAERRPAVQGQPLLHTAHQGLESADHALGLRRRGVHPVYVVHDLIPITHPEYTRLGEDERHRRRMRHALAHGRGIVVNSLATLTALTCHARETGLPLPPTVVAPLAPGVRRAAAGGRPMAAPYFVVLGTVEPRKNHGLLLKVWRELVQRGGAAAPHLVVIGRRGWDVVETMNLLQRCPALQGHVHHHAGCGDAELATWLHHAQALLFPTFCEGYGLPAVEAVAAGVPVIASDLPVFRESVGDVPEYVSPLDGPRWRDLVADYAGPRSARREAQLQRIARFRAPSWDDHHRPVRQLLEALA
jgi:glycosyltransferase involved in cell wall biosynthesis